MKTSTDTDAASAAPGPDSFIVGPIPVPAVASVAPADRRAPGYRVARVVSDLLSPPVLALAVFWILAGMTAGPGRWLAFLASIVTQSLFPLAFLGLAVRRGHIGDLNMSRREERRRGMATLGVVYALGVVLVALAGVRGPILFVCICSLAVLGALWAVNLVYKASGHAAGCAAYMTAISLFVEPLHAGFALLPVVGWARLRTGAHTLMQVILGALLGAGVALGFYWLVRPILF
jgi:membrane-associated phospholipid phosphatase